MRRRLNLRHVICPIDFSPLSTVSLARATAIARARRAELRAVHVVPAEGPGVSGGFDSIRHQAVISRLRTCLAAADPTYDRIGAAARSGDPATEILRFARAMRAGLIVIGAPGADRPERPVGPVGSVVVARSQCPVLTVPANQTTGSSHEAGLFARIVCGVDLTPSSASVIPQALSLAWETRGRLTYVCVLPARASASPARARDELLSAIPSDANHWCEIDVVVTKGVASDEIVAIASGANADLVVIGPPRRWTSTTHAVLSRSLCPVLVTHDAHPLPRPPVVEARDRVRTAL